jgi:hypothetical protein
MNKLLIAAALLSCWLLPTMARAACSSPAAEESEIIYNGDYKVMSMGAVSPAAGGSITVQFTTATYNGNLGGLSGANAKCQSEFSGSYFCQTEDYLRSGETSTTEGWVHNDGGYPTYANCGGWSSSSSVHRGLTNISYDDCNISYKLACCSQ